MIPAAEILRIAGEPEREADGSLDHFRRHLLFMHYTLRLPWMSCFHMADAMRRADIGATDAEYIAAHWKDDLG